MTTPTIPEVFILESLTIEENINHKTDGKILFDLLRISGYDPKYFYFEHKSELPHLLQIFKLSNYRYLHISCHASNQAIYTTYDEISNSEFGKIFRNFLKSKRISFSACEAGNEILANCLSTNNKGMHSIVAPAEEIQFSHAGAFWASFYVSIFSKNHNSMNINDIEKVVRLLCQLFPVDFQISSYKANTDTWKHTKILKKTGQVINL